MSLWMFCASNNHIEIYLFLKTLETPLTLLSLLYKLYLFANSMRHIQKQCSRCFNTICATIFWHQLFSAFSIVAIHKGTF